MNALLICPEFFDYATHMQNAIERQGLQCSRIDEKPSNTSVAKIIIRLFGQKKSSKNIYLKVCNIRSIRYILIHLTILLLLKPSVYLMSL